MAVWDVRRPYIPFASFTEHSDDVTGKQEFGIHIHVHCVHYIFYKYVYTCSIRIYIHCIYMYMYIQCICTCSSVVCKCHYRACSLLDFLWLNENVLLSCSKDCKLVQQTMAQAERPANKAVSEGSTESGVYCDVLSVCTLCISHAVVRLQWACRSALTEALLWHAVTQSATAIRQLRGITSLLLCMRVLYGV